MSPIRRARTARPTNVKKITGEPSDNGRSIRAPNIRTEEDRSGRLVSSRATDAGARIFADRFREARGSFFWPGFDFQDIRQNLSAPGQKHDRQAEGLKHNPRLSSMMRPPAEMVFRAEATYRSRRTGRQCASMMRHVAMSLKGG